MRQMPSKRDVDQLFDPVAERTVISAILEHGSKIFYDIDSLISETDFHAPENRAIYSTIKHLILKENQAKPDITSVFGIIQSNDRNFAEKYDVYQYLTALAVDTIIPENVNTFAAIVARRSAARLLVARLEQAKDRILKSTGQESLLELIAEAEKPVVDFTSNLITNDEVVNLSVKAEDYLDYVHTEKPEYLGVPSGFALFDQYIGCGLRAPGFHLVGGRAKSGKSFLGLNVADYVTKLKIPVLLLDTELTEQLTLARWLGLRTGIEYQSIETGDFDIKEAKKLAQMDKCPFYYFNISGRKHTEWISIIRKWITRYVGFDENGRTKDCLVILDYLKTMDLSDAGGFDEFQYLGQISTDLHNCCIKYNFPMLALCQLNRDGISRLDQGVIAGSDRIMWLCSSFSILALKTEEDFAADPKQNGDRKLVVVASRFGKGMDNGEYINIKSDLAKSKLAEGNTNVANRKRKNSPQNLISNNNDDDSITL